MVQFLCQKIQIEASKLQSTATNALPSSLLLIAKRSVSGVPQASHVTTTTGILAVSVKKSSSVATGGSPYGAGVFAADGSREATETELALAKHRGNYVGAIVKRLAKP